MDVLGDAEIGVTMITYAHVLRVLRQGRPMPLTSCSERDMSGSGSRIGNSKGHSKIGRGLWTGALGGTRTPNLLIRSPVPGIRRVHRGPFAQVRVQSAVSV